MARASNNLMGALNMVTFIISLAIIGVGIWVSVKADSLCERFLQYFIYGIGGFLLIISVLGFVGTCCRVTSVLCTYLVVMLLLIIAYFAFAVFVFVVTNKGAGHAVSNRGFKEYRLGDYSSWLQKRVEDSSNWRRIKSCLMKADVCDDLQSHNYTQQQFYALDLSPIESGCCKPPTDCNFTYVKPTIWDITSGNSNTTDNEEEDCQRWSNDQENLCYDCDSCKAGVLQTIKERWKEITIANAIILVILIIVYSISCCAYRNNRKRDRQRAQNQFVRK